MDAQEVEQWKWKDLKTIQRQRIIPAYGLIYDVWNDEGELEDDFFGVDDDEGSFHL